MIRTAFRYAAPIDAAEAAALLAADGDACLMAGGTWLVPELTQGQRRPSTVVDLGRAGLAAISADDGTLSVGATATYADVAAAPAIRANAPILAALAEGITGGAQIRNQGTLGGSVCHAYPSSDVPASLVALSANLVLLSEQGVRHVPAAEFFVGDRQTSRRQDEVLTEIRVPVGRPRERFGYRKLTFGRGSWPVATAACVIEVAEDGHCLYARLALGGVAPVPVEVPVQSEIVGALVGSEVADALAEAATAAIDDPWSDELADGSYRRAVAGVLASRALLDAWTL